LTHCLGRINWTKLNVVKYAVWVMVESQ